MKTIIFYTSGCIFIFLNHLQSQPTGSYYDPTVIQGQTISVAHSPTDIFYGPSQLFSPGTNPSTMDINQGAIVEYKAGDEIILTDGFTAGDFDPVQGGNQAGEFRAYIDKPLDIVTIAPNSSQIDPTDHLLHVKKWEKFEWAIRLPEEYNNAILKFFNRHFNYINPALVAEGLDPTAIVNPALNQYSQINPYDNISVPVGTPELNPYAFDSLEIKFEFTSPTGLTYTKYGFFMREVIYGSVINGTGSEMLKEDIGNPLNDYHMHVRFAPNEETSGNQVWRIKSTIWAPSISSLPPYSVYLTDFKCDPPDQNKHGYLNVNPTTHRNLQFEDGTGFFGFGENVINMRDADLNNVTPIYPSWKVSFKDNYDDNLQEINELASAGGNMIRLIMCDDNYAFMTEDLNAYDAYYSSIYCLNADRAYWGNRQYSARKMDEIFDVCYNKNIYIQLSPLFSFPQNWAEWSSFGHNMFFKKFVTNFDQLPINPAYPLPIENFWKNSGLPGTATQEVEYYWKRYFKYLMSRWGYSINLGILEPMQEVDQALGFTPENYASTDPTNGSPYYPDLCENHRGTYTNNEVSNIRTAIDEWYTMVGNYIRNLNYTGGLMERYIPMLVSYTGAPLHFYAQDPNTGKFFRDWQTTADYCFLFNNDQIDLLDIHNYEDRKEVFKINYDLSIDIHDQSKYNVNQTKPFASGELATSGSIPDPNNSSEWITTFQFYNNYNISHHNEIWGSAFTGNFHSGLTFWADASHKWHGGTPIDYSGMTLGLTYNLNDPFNLTFPNGNIFNDNIKSSFHNYRPFADFIGPQGADIDFTQNYTPYALYDYQSTGLEAYYIVNDAQTNVYGWIHNIEHYWNNEFYYNQANNNWNLCSTQSMDFTQLTSPWDEGIPVFGLNAYAFYDLTFYYTRMGTPTIGPTIPSPINGIRATYYNSSTTNGYPIGAYEFIPASAIIDFMQNYGCDTMHADFAFKLHQQGSANRANDTTKTQSNRLPIVNLYPNPTSDLFYLSTSNGKIFRDEGVFRIKIFDTTGKLILQDDVGKENLITISLKDVTPGMYLIEIITQNSVQFKKIIKQ